MNFVGANPDVVAAGREELQSHSNYFIGNDSSKWLTDVPNFGQVKLIGLYDTASPVGGDTNPPSGDGSGSSGDGSGTNPPSPLGGGGSGVRGTIDAVLHTNSDRQLEYDFIVHPGADASQVRMSFDGALGSSIDADGNLVIQTAAGPFIQPLPTSYQVNDDGT